ncbi:hypothetical protein VVR84_12380 [Kocuria carniphila]|uniref:HTTM domain-containing protein n=1 Tax=Kocuria carniphila TaxID=262208 RepID=A0ABV3V6P4_9MICC|nr:hypothetical protein [Kocuria sp. WRN011]MDN5699626.1 hypothetical protein [Kocuria sp.]
MRILKELRGSATPARPAIHPLEVTERAGAATHLLSSLEYVVRPQDRTLGGLNHWASMREGFPDSLRWMVPIYDYFSHEGRLGALHASRAVAAAILLVPRSTPHSGHRNTARAILNGYLALSQLAVYPRHFYGTDGSDQVSFLVQSAAAVGRLSHPTRGRDHAAAFIACQIVLSYCASGLAKLPGQKWISGEALPLIMRTQTYGDSWLYTMLRRYPSASRALSHSVLTMETFFPAFMLGKGRVIDPALTFMGAFHLANARFMGLSRFAVAFIGTYPCVSALAKGTLNSKGGRK